MRVSLINRRKFVKCGGALGAWSLIGGLGAPTVFAARPIKIGYVSPQTGPLAGFGDADSYILGGINDKLKGGLALGKQTYPIEILVRDSQSNPNRAAEVAKDLIVKDKIDMMVVASTPETTNPVSTQCEIEEIPCISTVAPWQPYFIGRQANPGDPKS
jgi:branched-chain amino acid transport system substrate-binding protein